MMPTMRCTYGLTARRRPATRRVLAIGAMLALLGAGLARAGDVSLTRAEAIARALQHNQRIIVSGFSRDIARADLLTAYGRFDPALTFKRSYAENAVPVTATPLVDQLTKTDDYALSLNGLTPWGMSYQLGGTAENQRGTYNAFSNNFVTFGGVTITQPLLRGFGFGANLADLRIAKANRAISDWDFRQTVIDIVSGVVLAYEDVAEARANLQIAERSRDLAAQLVSDNEKRNRIGTISDADVTQARARVANREEQILLAERSLRDRENRLRELMGEPVAVADAPPLLLDALTPETPPAADGAADLQRALALRPDFQAAKLGIDIRRVADRQARNERLPRVDFVGSYGYNGIDPDFAASRAQVRNEDHRAYSAGVVVSVPLTFAEGRGRAHAARLALRRSEADLTRLEQDIAVGVAAAIGQLKTTAQRVAATTRAYELAQQALDAEQKRFRAGTSTTFVLLQLQEQLASVQSSQVRAIADQRRAIVDYERELGATVDAYHLKLQ